MSRKLLLLAVIYIGIVMAAGSQTLSLDPITTPATVTYDPDSSSDTTGPQFSITVRISWLPLSNINYFITINGSPTVNSRNLVLTDNSAFSILSKFYKDSAFTQEILGGNGSGMTSTQVLSGQFKRFTITLTKTFTVYPLIQKNQQVPYGTYAGTFTARLYQGTVPNAGTLMDSENFTYTAIVNQKVDVRIGPATGSYDTGSAIYNINLGELSNGASGTFAIFLKANTAYTLKMSAASGGYLTSATTSDKIQYTLTIDGVSKTLGPEVIIDQETAKQLYSKVLLGAISVAAGQDVEAGQYSDSIEFTIIAN
jgi:hypothetical protein